MANRPFRITQPLQVTIDISIAPVYSALTSMAALNAVDRLGDIDAWLSETAAALTPDQRRTNRLVFEWLGEALTTERDWPDFEAYLDDLAQQSPRVLRDRVLEPLLHDATIDRAALLNNVDALGSRLAALHPGEAPDADTIAALHTLLNHPAQLHDLIVTHLRGLWDGTLADEWRRIEPMLRNLADALRQRTLPATTAADTIRAFTGRDLSPMISGQLEGVQHIVFVLSPHIGSYASRFGSDTTIWVFTRAIERDDNRRRPAIQSLPLRQTPVKAVELVNPFSALADETRLHILELLAQHGDLLAQEIIARLDLSQSSISRHLKQLVSSGLLIERRGEGANKRYRLNPARIDWLFSALRQVLDSATPIETIDTRANQEPELRRFLDAESRVIAWPSRRADQQLVLRYLANKFEYDRQYSEKEVNGLLRRWNLNRDPATLRRDMFDSHLLDRDRNGARYWRAREDR